MEKTLVSKESNADLPVIRIKKVALEDFKNVVKGEVVLNCGKEFVPYWAGSDILGIYGQNGSGKTSLIEALSILKFAMGGKSVPGVYADCVGAAKKCARLEFVFDMQYQNGVVREATYSFCIEFRYQVKEELVEPIISDEDAVDAVVVINNEKFWLMERDENGKIVSKRQLIIDTSSEEVPFTPDTKRIELVGTEAKVQKKLDFNKQWAELKSKSFVFMQTTLEMFDKASLAFKVLTELQNYALHCLYVVDTKSSGLIMLNYAIPIYTKKGRITFDAKLPKKILTKYIEEIRAEFGNISSVLEQLVPGLTIGLKEILPDSDDKTGEPAIWTLPDVCRDGMCMHLRCESDGIKKIISVLGIIIEAFNRPSVTVAIDEFDAGVFEYLLGEILQAFEESGQGQFIFTSHNLRPLEVINKKFLCFTTTDPENRYIRLKNISATNNLRDTFFRKIVCCGQKEKLCNRKKLFEIIDALENAGRKH